MNKVPVMNEIMIIAVWTVINELVNYGTTTQGKPSVHELTYLRTACEVIHELHT